MNTFTGLNDDKIENGDVIQYVTIIIGNQLFGLPISQVHDVFSPERVTRVPLSPTEIAGVLNLRGRIVTAIDMRQRLHLPKKDNNQFKMAVGIEYKYESYGLIIDEVGEVLFLSVAEQEPNPANLDPHWKDISRGVHRLGEQLMVILDINRLLEGFSTSAAA